MASPAKLSVLPPKRSTSVISASYTSPTTCDSTSTPRRSPWRSASASVSMVKPLMSANSAAPCAWAGGICWRASARRRSWAR
jgi:hypothetical protein